MRLLALPDNKTILDRYIQNQRTLGPHLRLGQFVWNTWGYYGTDGEGWPELYYAYDPGVVFKMLDKYRSL